MDFLNETSATLGSFRTPVNDHRDRSRISSHRDRFQRPRSAGNCCMISEGASCGLALQDERLEQLLAETGWGKPLGVQSHVFDDDSSGESGLLHFLRPPQLQFPAIFRRISPRESLFVHEHTFKELQWPEGLRCLIVPQATASKEKASAKE